MWRSVVPHFLISWGIWASNPAVLTTSQTLPLGAPQFLVTPGHLNHNPGHLNHNPGHPWSRQVTWTRTLVTPAERHQRQVSQASTAVKRASSTWSSLPFWIRMQNEWNYNRHSSLIELYRHYKEVAREALAWDQFHNDGHWQRKPAWIWTFAKFWAFDSDLGQSSVWKPCKPFAHEAPGLYSGRGGWWQSGKWVAGDDVGDEADDGTTASWQPGETDNNSHYQCTCVH